MPAPEEILSDSPADFDSSFAYALHGDMRRLLIVTIIGSILLSLGMALFLQPGFVQSGARLLRRLIGLVVALLGATFFYGGIVAIAFKVVADANIVAAAWES